MYVVNDGNGGRTSQVEEVGSSDWTCLIGCAALCLATMGSANVSASITYFAQGL